MKLGPWLSSASLFLLARSIPLGFGRLVVSTRRFPQPTNVPREVELELEALVGSPDGSRALGDLLDTWSASPGALMEQALRALGSGRLHYEAWTPSPGLIEPRRESRRLEELVSDEPDETPLHAVILVLVDLQDRPVPGARYHLVDPEGRNHHGVLDRLGRVEIEGIRKAGACKVSFPEFDSRAWSYVSAHPL